MAAPNRRALLLAGLAVPALVATSAKARPLHDPAAWAAMLADYLALHAAERVWSHRHAEAEEYAMQLRRMPRPPKPGELTVWHPPVVWEKGADRIEVPDAFRTFERRSEVERWAASTPDRAAAVLAAWDAWVDACEVGEIEAGLPEAYRRQTVLDKRWQRIFNRRDAARDRLLAYPTLDPAAIRTKLEIIEDAGDPDATAVELANSFLAALGFQERL